MVPGEKTTSDEPEEIKLDTKKKFLMVRIVRQRNRLLMEVMDSPSAENLIRGSTNIC